jgi:hypothetical protein
MAPCECMTCDLPINCCAPRPIRLFNVPVVKIVFFQFSK